MKQALQRELLSVQTALTHLRQTKQPAQLKQTILEVEARIEANKTIAAGIEFTRKRDVTWFKKVRTEINDLRKYLTEVKVVLEQVIEASARDIKFAEEEIVRITTALKSFQFLKIQPYTPESINA